MNHRRLLVAIAAIFAATASCVRNPATGNLELSLVSESQEIEMGKQGAAEVAQSIGLYSDPKLESYIQSIGSNISSHTPRAQLPWQFHVVDDSSVNAFALPGGPVFITRGILAHMNSEAELVSVMGHECGHIIARHSVEQITKAEVAQVGLGLGMIFSPALRNLGQAAGAGMQMLFLKFSRDNESQADQLGFKYMTGLGYDPHEMSKLFVLLEGVTKAAGGGKLPEWQQTHPAPENRLKATEARIGELGGKSGDTVEREKYLKMIDGIVFGDDPRQGFFQGQTFLHPGLKFKLEFPSGWKTANQPQAVIGVSPQQDAALQLAPAPGMTPEQAAQKFFSQKGIQQGKAAEGQIHGSSAVSAYFAAQSQQGDIAGLATFLSYGGQTYAMFGYTAAQQMSSYDEVFRKAMGSFSPLTDSSVLNVQPARVQLVRLDKEMSLSEFSSKYPSNATETELALINGVEAGGTLKSGQLAKRIVGGPDRKQAQAAGGTGG